MNRLPPLVSVVDIKNHHLKVFAMLKDGPMALDAAIFATAWAAGQAKALLDASTIETLQTL